MHWLVSRIFSQSGWFVLSVLGSVEYWNLQATIAQKWPPLSNHKKTLAIIQFSSDKRKEVLCCIYSGFYSLEFILQLFLLFFFFDFDLLSFLKKNHCIQTSSEFQFCFEVEVFIKSCIKLHCLLKLGDA